VAANDAIMPSTDAPSDPPDLLHRLKTLIRARDGSLTRELLRKPGRFGLGQVPAAASPDATTAMVCGYCSTGCSLDVHLRDGVAVNLTPSTDYPVNLGMACPKGWEALTVLDAPDRAVDPILKGPDGVRRPVDWDLALKTMAARIKAVQAEHGPDSFAFLGTGQLPTEELALLGAVAKFGLGMVHGDGNTRQCMATAAVAYKQSFGFDSPPFTYQDLEESDCLIFVGANPCIAHPILWERVVRNKHRPEIIVVDPRKTETATSATLHLAIAPKSDQTLLYGLAKLLIEAGKTDPHFIAAHTEGFEAFARFVEDYPVDRVASETGLDEAAILDFAARVARGKRVSYWWTMGVNQSYQGVRTAQALINLALMTGMIGRPGTGANSLTGQCNAMGSRLYSNTSSLLGGRDFTSEADRVDVARILDIPADRIPDRPSWRYDEIVEGIRAGQIRGLWVVATNPVHSWINHLDLHELLGKLDFLVVQDMYHSTETAKVADLLLPAAAWGEKEGTFINSERRIGIIKKVRRPPGQALADFQIFRLVAEYCGVGNLFAEWTSPEAAFGILRRLSAEQPCDMTGIADYRMIDEARGVQWPCPKGMTAPIDPDFDHQRRLFADGQFSHADGRARFWFESPRPHPEPVDDDYPLILLTGRGSASQWHTETRTSKSDVLRKLYPSETRVDLHPEDATRFEVDAGSKVVVESRRGAMTARAFVSPTVRPGQIFVAMHDNAVNSLTFPSFDPYSRQPSYKACAVAIRRHPG